MSECHVPEDNGTLETGEYHPSANSAMKYIREYIAIDPYILEAITSTALSGNRTSELCYETLRRIMNDEPVSDRYLLGLAWFLKQIEESKES